MFIVTNTMPHKFNLLEKTFPNNASKQTIRIVLLFQGQSEAWQAQPSQPSEKRTKYETKKKVVKSIEVIL